ncbi:hypothetical protein HBI30_097840 [Parastagonospora nodorum]|nr:hypothetical protein HBI30_097840 [Parastagonospora nodorum]
MNILTWKTGGLVRKHLPDAVSSHQRIISLGMLLKGECSWSLPLSPRYTNASRPFCSQATRSDISHWSSPQQTNSMIAQAASCLDVSSRIQRIEVPSVRTTCAARRLYAA